MEKEIFIRLIKNVVGNIDSFKIGTSLYKKVNPSFHIGKTTEKQEYAIKLFIDKDVFCVWNLKRRREVSVNVSETLTLLGNSWKNMSIDSNSIICQYKWIGKRYTGDIEKVYIVGTKHLRQFFEHIDEYMLLNEFDEEFKSNSINQIIAMKGSKDHKIRERYSSTRWKRDNKFREEVLCRYGNKCVICGCKISEVLEAAHEHGFEPGKTNWDDPEHGICLCRNHHKMYDDEMISIDLKNQTFSVNENMKMEEMIYVIDKQYTLLE